MKTNVLCLIFLINFSFITAQKIYSTSQSYKADFNVFVVDNEYQADLKVYKVSRPYEAKKNVGYGILPICRMILIKKFISVKMNTKLI